MNKAAFIICLLLLILCSDTRAAGLSEAPNPGVYYKTLSDWITARNMYREALKIEKNIDRYLQLLFITPNALTNEPI